MLVKCEKGISTGYMAYTAKWIVKNKKVDLIFTSLSNFWSIVENDESAMVQHSILNRRYTMDKGGFLAKDGKTILYWMMFRNEDDYKRWSEAYKKLPPIDEDLEWVEIEEMDTEKYIPYRDGKPFSV